MNKIALVGRPNTGKSTLFNIIIERKKSIIDDIPGVTRDRLVAKVDYYGKEFDLIDTGGYEDGHNEISVHIQEQIKIAIHEAQVIIFIVDAKTGLMSEDIEMANIIRKLNKKTIVAVNKVDNDKIIFSDFYKLGFELLMPVSAVHKIGLGDLLDEATNDFTKE